MSRSPLESLIDAAVRCITCGAKLGECDGHPESLDLVAEELQALADAAVVWRDTPNAETVALLEARVDALIALGWR